MEPRPPTSVSPTSVRPLGTRALEAMKARHLSARTIEAYLGWMRRYHAFLVRKDPARFGAERVTAFLNHLATDLDVRASTQNQALSALIFLYREVLGVALPWLDDLVRARRSQRLPVVLSREEVAAVLTQMTGPTRLMATLLYGAGLRLMECCRLRIQDLDFQRQQLIIREGKGDKDRVTLLPASLHAALRAQVEESRLQHQADVARGAGWVELPHRLDLKLGGQGQTWPWQWVFPATRTYRHAASGQVRRHHLHETVVQRAVTSAVRSAGSFRGAFGHTCRRSCASHLLAMGVRSPLDRLTNLVGEGPGATYAGLDIGDEIPWEGPDDGGGGVFSVPRADVGAGDRLRGGTREAAWPR